MLPDMVGIAVFVATALAAGAPDAVRPCSARAEGAGGMTISPERDIRIGPVVFFGLRHPERQSFPGTHGRDPGSKIPIAVRAGAPVLLRVPSGARGSLGLNYATRSVARLERAQSLVQVEPCSPATRRFTDGRPIGRWTGFSGGLVVRAPGCYPLEVARHGKPFVRRRVALGKRC